MFSICVLIVAAAAVYMVEAYIHTYYAIEYMHGAPLFFVLLAKYAAPVLFLLLCGYFVFRYREKRRESEKPAREKHMNREEVYAEKINATVKTKAVFSDQANQMLYQVMRFGQKMAVAYSMTQDSKISGEQAKCLTLLASAERIFYDRLDDAIRSASMFDETEYKAFQQGTISFGDTDTAKKKQEIYAGIIKTINNVVHNNERLILRLDSLAYALSVSSVLNATIDGKLMMGYSNPYTSATGLNFLLAALASSGSDTIVDTAAVENFQKFQANVPLVSFTTQQMVQSADKGIVDGVVMEYQSYQNDPTLQRNYEFIPFGVRHDNPLYSIGNVSAEKKEVIAAFVSFCAQNQAEATKDGFNGLDDYVYTGKVYDGNTIAQAQSVWKEEKDSGIPIVAEFVVDTSGSMRGEPLNALKTAMINTIQYINDDNYIGIIGFDSDVREYLPIDQFSLTQKTLYKGAVNSLDANGNTAMYNGLCVAIETASGVTLVLNGKTVFASDDTSYWLQGAKVIGDDGHVYGHGETIRDALCLVLAKYGGLKGNSAKQTKPVKAVRAW